MIILLLAACASASVYSEYLRGFLSGFQGTEVFLGDNCLDARWIDKVENDYEMLVQSLSEQKYASVLAAGQSLFFDLLSEMNDCHIKDLKNILDSISEMKIATKLIRLVENMPEILVEIGKAEIDNPYTTGYHLGKALSYLENDKNLNIPNIDPEEFSNFVQGIIRPLVVLTPNCTNAFTHCLGATLKKLMGLINTYIEGDTSVFPDILKAIGQLDTIRHHMQELCESEDLPEKLSEAFTTKDGLIQSYLKFGMHLQDFIALEKRAGIHLLAQNFGKLGEDIGNMVKILII